MEGYQVKNKIVEIIRIVRIIGLFGLIGGLKYIHYYKKAAAGSVSGGKSIKLKYAHSNLMVRTNSTDLLLIESMLIGRFVNRKWVGEYNQVESYIRKISEDEPVIIDAGANIGLFCRLILKENSASKIYAIEPEEKNYQLLKANTKNYDVRPLRGGVWSHDCHLKVVPRETGDWGFTVKEVEEADDNSIKAIGMNSLIEKYGLSQIDLVKMDVEGSEYEIFNSDNLEWLDVCRAIVIETHDHIVKGADALVNKMLLDRGFSKFFYEENQFFIKM